MNILLKNHLSDEPKLCMVPYMSDETSLASLFDAFGLKKNEVLSYLLKPSTKDFSISHGEQLLIFMKTESGSFAKLMKQFRKKAYSFKDYYSCHWALYALHISSQEECEKLVQAFIHGCLTSTQNIGKNKTTSDFEHALSDTDATVTIYSNFSDLLSGKIHNYQHIARAHLNAMILGNSPSNKKDVNYLTAYCDVLAKKHNLEIDIFTKEQLELEGFKALLAVNRGSEQPAKFIVLKYNMGAADRPLVALVGKGVLFDTGGINLKPTDNLFLMKSDMCGAAAVLGAIEAVAATGCNIRALAAIPLTDNAIDAKSTKPGDVIGSYNGKTIEVIDTDAEGRLCLADAISYVCRTFSPDYLIDIATLTGSAARALGQHYAALFSASEALSSQLTHTGMQTGEKLWPMPMDADYKEDLHSDVADLANYSNKPTAGAISAALFLSEFVENTSHWAHIDIAGTAFTTSELGKQRNATGYGVLLLYNFIKDLSEKQ